MVPLVLVWPRHNPHPDTKTFVANAQRAVRNLTAS
jgi:hypothetical protein